MTIDSLLRQAVGHHQRGAFADAEALYAQVLQHDPANFDALHLTGVLARQRGDAQRALELIGRAIALDGTRAIAHCNLGAAQQDAGRDGDALASYDRALALQPAYPLALCNRANALRRLGRLDEALDSYAAALALSPGYPEALCNRALALQELGRHEAALDGFAAALAVRPAWPEAVNGAAVSLLATGDADGALQGFDRALQLRPGYAEAWCGRASLLLYAGQPEAALDSWHRALAARPGYARAQLGLANTLRALGRHEAAVIAYRQAKKMGADAATVDYLLAALGAGAAPQASPPDYVAALFDSYAPRFDRHLVDELRYRTPALLAGLLRRHLPRVMENTTAENAAAEHTAADLDVLDLGCGTGLCGPLLRPVARHLAGVDLSRAMLARAGALDVYDELACADIVAFLRDDGRRWDVLAAADVLVYVGDLDALFAAARRALRAGGVFAFSVEMLEDGAAQGSDSAGYALRRSGRYAHAAPYLQQQATRHGFALRALESCTLRQDSGVDVAGLLAVMALA
ncbi:tetratricopeptide repeat protein [Pseudoduganella umbonata]|uniref:Putative TPR repeat methyltransferase n=1 Tax=Pseudoduganella umbonata TaxID=864828 RepID=A0A4P8HX51_9BURK|nr:tetratricopeptide repeat protein [Pseudoduganella umbonata]MBB3222968.1 putative TPR repeat methyltransferase [Pseudoduganella umbonata]QCP13084.1 tetratricopeptide repeat protein [Pseudoduganella umbonata]